MEERGAPPAAGHVAPRRPRVLPWALANLGLFLLAVVVGAVVIGMLDTGRLGVGQGLYAAGFFIPVIFPGWLLHLAILGLLPAEWPRSRARLLSALTSPLWLILPYFTEGLFVGPLHAVALAYALVARLRQPKESERPTVLSSGQMHRSLLLVVLLVPGLSPYGASATVAQPISSCPAPDQPLQFDNYWVGPRFEDLYLIEVARVCIPDAPLPHGNVAYVYENCSEFDVGCGRRIEVAISSTPFTEEHRANLDMYGKATNVGGLPGRVWGTQLAIYFPEATVFLGGGDDPQTWGYRELWYRLGGALRPGPIILADLSRYGIRFPESCTGVGRCEAEAASRRGLSVLQRVVNVAGVGSLIFLFGVAPVLIFRRRGQHPPFEPERRLLAVAGMLAAIAGVILYVLLRLSPVLTLPGLAVAITSFLVLGRSVRPRGSNGRGIALGGLAYLWIGLVSYAFVGRAESVAEFFTSESFLWIAVGWPAIPAYLLAGSLGT